MENVAQENEKTISGAIKIDEKEIRTHLDGLVRQSVEDTLNALLDIAIATAVRLEPAETVAGFQINKPGLHAEPIHPDLAGNGTILCPNHTFRDAVRQQFRRERVQPDAALQFQEKAEVLSRNDFALLSRRPFRKRLGVAPVGFAGSGIDRAVGDNIFAVKGVSSLQNQAVRRASHDECGGFAFRNFPRKLSCGREPEIPGSRPASGSTYILRCGCGRGIRPPVRG